MSKDSSRLDDDETEMEDDPTAVFKKSAGKSSHAVEEEPVAEIEEPEADAPEETVEPEARKSTEREIDPLDKPARDRDIAREAKRIKDEWAGKQYGWLRKDIKEKYRGKQQEFESVLKKGEEFDALKARLDAMEATMKAPKPDAQPVGDKVSKPKPAISERAKKIATDRNLREENAGVIEDIMSGVLDIMQGQGPLETEGDFEKRLAEAEWKKATQWAESQDDYKTDLDLQAKAEWRARKLGERPDVALLAARKEMPAKKVVKRVTGPAQKGTPAFAKDQGAMDDAPEYDGKTDPLETVRAKWKKK